MAVQGLNRPRGRSRTLFSPLPSYPPSFFSSLCSSSGTARFRLIPLARSANPNPGIDEPMTFDRPAKRRYDELRYSGARARSRCNDIASLRFIFHPRSFTSQRFTAAKPAKDLSCPFNEPHNGDVPILSRIVDYP